MSGSDLEHYVLDNVADSGAHNYHEDTPADPDGDIQDDLVDPDVDLEDNPDGCFVDDGQDSWKMKEEGENICPDLNTFAVGNTLYHRVYPGKNIYHTYQVRF